MMAATRERIFLVLAMYTGACRRLKERNSAHSLMGT